MDSKTYTYELYEALAPGGMTNTYFDIEEQNRQIRVKRLLWTARLTIPAINNLIPIDNHPLQYFMVGIGIPANRIFNPVFNPLNPLITLDNGNRFNSYEPGEYNFNSSFVENQFRVGCVVNNWDALNTVGVRMNFLIEVDLI